MAVRQRWSTAVGTAIRAQSLVRMAMARKHFLKQKEASSTIQRFSRALAGRRGARKGRTLAVLADTLWRADTCRRREALALYASCADEGGASRRADALARAADRAETEAERTGLLGASGVDQRVTLGRETVLSDRAAVVGGGGTSGRGSGTGRSTGDHRALVTSSRDKKGGLLRSPDDAHNP